MILGKGLCSENYRQKKKLNGGHDSFIFWNVGLFSVND